MSEKIVQKESTNSVKDFKERFEFVLTINGYIACQRYFRIMGFNTNSESSTQLAGCWGLDKEGRLMNGVLDYCIRIIDDDLKAKTQVYLQNAAPMLFESIDEMNSYIAKHGDTPFIYMMTKDSDKTYVVKDEHIVESGIQLNHSDWFNDGDVQPCILKFAILDNGHEICSKAWDGNVYPKFVRTNIDLSNSKNRFKNPDNFSLYDAQLIDLMNEGHVDLIPVIVREICSVCALTEDDDYTSKVKYGKTVYDLNLRRSNYKMLKQMESDYKKKTDKYFKNIGD